MTGIDAVTLEKAIVHKIGNPTRGEELKLSANALTLNDEIVRGLLCRYFLAPFNEHDCYHFTHISNLDMNEVYAYVKQVFDDPASFQQQSVYLAQLLYQKSTHVRVKEGELYVALFDKISFEGEERKALGIFKSETKETFLKVFAHGSGWELSAEDGININKLDKGCLVFRTNENDGYKVCVVDNTNKQQDTQYWVNDFLQVKPYSDSYHHTNQALGLCKLFIENEYAEKFDVSKSDQIDLLNKSMDYFKTREQFNLQEFADEVIHHPDVVDTFMDYKKNFEASRNYAIDESFDINGMALKKQARLFKTVLKLDKNFHVYIHGRRDLIERGYDEETGKKFYKLYYEEES
ncbi:nucleoid-associated protein [Flavihumibacter profundi]|uniref:nucleoid-associated protein n=1 Tax=Flavihumibacter profundi TaxID=2716883 RepID=UPI001CC6E684|nr:nucleoid-associated protein [Flavihumibacter profundi]MBZ5857138.1 nucleoid-associated protein [Flavihumibacter profundi]